MVRSLEPLHAYTVCPRCRAATSPYQRFCRTCAFWLARPGTDALRRIQSGPETQPGTIIDRLRLLISAVKGMSHVAFVVPVTIGIAGALLVTVYVTALVPHMGSIGPKARERACYENIRVIQTALEGYLTGTLFTPALASDPVGVLASAGFLSSRPRCPIPGNRYTIPRGSSLQCVGPEGHGRPH